MYQKVTIFAGSTLALMIAFLWGFSEAVWFFIIPDIFLTLIALFSLKRALVAMVWTILGAMLGGAILYWF
jgi:membrane protein YqaA with SNARE-associated domain